MNERIKELATQAGFHSYITTHKDDVAMFEKFAELIIRDCVEICYGIQLKSGWIAPRACGDDILKHFGIEE